MGSVDGERVPFSGVATSVQRNAFSTELVGRPTLGTSGIPATIYSLTAVNDEGGLSGAHVYVGCASGQVFRYGPLPPLSKKVTSAAPSPGPSPEHSASQSPIASSGGSAYSTPTRRVPLPNGSGRNDLLKELAPAASAVVGRSPVLALCLLPEVRRIAALCEGQVTVLRVDSLAGAAQLAPARDGLLLARQLGAPPTPPPAPQQLARMAVATRGKLLLFELHLSQVPAGNVSEHPRQRARWGLTAAVVREIGGAEEALALAWLGDSILVGMATEYRLLSLQTGFSMQLFALPPDSPPPLVAPLVGANEALLLCGAAGIVINTQGHPQGGSVVLQNAPSGLAHCPPLVAAVGGGQLEAYDRASGARIQSLPLASTGNKPALLAADSSGRILVAATPGKVWLVTQAAPEDQSRDLMRRGEFDAAVAVAGERAPGEGEEVVSSRVAMARAQAGFLLLASLRFEKAIDVLLAAEVVSPAELFPLFPAVTARWRSLVSRRRYWGLHAPLIPLEDMVHTTLQVAPSHSLLAPVPPASTNTTVEEYLLAAKHSIARFLTAARQRPLDPAELAGADTLLVYLLGDLGEAAELEALAASPNSCEVDAAEAFLREGGWWSPLALLLEQRGQVARAAQVYADMVRAGGHPSAASKAAQLIEASSDAQLVLKHCRWLLEDNAELALQVLTSSARDSALPPDQALGLLRKSAPHLRLRYLHWLVLEQGSQVEAHHTQFACALADSAVHLITAGKSDHSRPGSTSADPSQQERSGEQTAGAVRGQLVAFLEGTSLYNSREVLDHLQATPLQREQVALLRRLGEHSAALRILALDLGDFAGAEKYCLELGSPDAFSELLEMYLAPGGGREPLHMAAVRLMHCHVPHLDPLRVLQVLPATMPLPQAVGTLALLLRERTHRHRQGQVVRQLARAINLEARLAAVDLRGRRGVITDETRCSACGVHLGTQLCAMLPDGALVCYKCVRRMDEHQQLPDAEVA